MLGFDFYPFGTPAALPPNTVSTTPYPSVAALELAIPAASNVGKFAFAVCPGSSLALQLQSDGTYWSMPSLGDFGSFVPQATAFDDATSLGNEYAASANTGRFAWVYNGDFTSILLYKSNGSAWVAS